MTLMPFVFASLNAKTGVIIGGGLLGLEGGQSIKRFRFRHHVVEFARLMAVQIDDLGGKILRSKNRKFRRESPYPKATSSIEEGTSATHVMKFGDGWKQKQTSFSSPQAFAHT